MHKIIRSASVDECVCRVRWSGVWNSISHAARLKFQLRVLTSCTCVGLKQKCLDVDGRKRMDKRKSGLKFNKKWPNSVAACTLAPTPRTVILNVTEWFGLDVQRRFASDPSEELRWINLTCSEDQLCYQCLSELLLASQLVVTESTTKGRACTCRRVLLLECKALVTSLRSCGSAARGRGFTKKKENKKIPCSSKLIMTHPSDLHSPLTGRSDPS